MQGYYKQILRLVDGMSPQEWIIVMAVLVVAGLFCFRGFGSRTRY